VRILAKVWQKSETEKDTAQFSPLCLLMQPCRAR